MVNIVIFGAPGSGKGTQSDLIIKKYGLHHISTGDILREEIANQSELGIIAERFISKGQLVPDELIIRMLAEILDKAPTEKGFIFDGFPRTLEQGEALDKLLKEKGTCILAALNLEVEESELIERILKRGALSGRKDDNLETAHARLKVYYSQTEPLKEFYKKQGKKINIKGTGNIEDIFERICQSIDRIIK
ncbi:MAG: adenylate kinase [Dysgonamonadaceae bacterium]|jgi:adenylate kinase|nr:adenylate kinase [Dysgonamonadaceae bacterium]